MFQQLKYAFDVCYFFQMLCMELTLKIIKKLTIFFFYLNINNNKKKNLNKPAANKHPKINPNN